MVVKKTSPKKSTVKIIKKKQTPKKITIKKSSKLNNKNNTTNNSKNNTTNNSKNNTTNNNKNTTNNSKNNTTNNSKNNTTNNNKNTVNNNKNTVNNEYPLIKPAFWVLQNNKKFPAWINKTFIKYKLTDKTKISSIDGKFKPFSYQLFLRDYMQNSSPYRGILLYHGLGSGKCFKKNTPILMTNGEIKMVQDIKINEKVMGDDLLPRNVLTTTIGRDKMYKIKQSIGDDYVVNSEHILCLKNNNGETMDISIKDCLNMDDELMGYKIKENKTIIYKIEIEEYGEDNYYGFSVDGNHRFLLGDNTVTHNSCSAITIAENLKTDKNIIGIMPASLKGNFIGTSKEGLLFCGDPKYKKNPNLINEHYTFISSNASNTIKQLNDIELDNHLIIIDEAHNLVSRMVGGLNGDNKQGRMIYNKLMNTKDCKIIALTGTPVVNDIYETGILLNILHGYMYITIFDIVYVSPKYGSNWNLTQLEKELEKEKYIDYLKINKQNKTIEFHLNIKPWHTDYKEKLGEITDIAKKMDINIQYNTYMEFTLFPDEHDGKGLEEFNNYFIDKNTMCMKNMELFKRRIAGLISYYKGKQDNLPKIKSDDYVNIVMSPYQFSEYEKVRNEEKSSRKLSEIRVFTRQYSNFVFPPEINRPGIGERVIKKEKDINQKNEKNESIVKVMKADDNDEDSSEVRKEELKRYQKSVELALNELSANSDKYLVKDKLGVYSNKMKTILENIEKTKGLVFVYSDFRSLEGVEIFSRVLNANGYSKYGNNNKLPKYAMYSGSEDLEERNEIKNIFSSSENKYGRDIKIILATSAGAEGLDLKNIRQVHIMESYWNNVRIKQVIGRAVRRNSHIDLPLNERDVSIYRYLSIISDDDQKSLKPKEKLSADQIILDIAKKKEKITDEMLKIMKDSAVDCVLNSLDNEGNINCISYGENVEGISYVPILGKDLGRGLNSEMRKVEQKLRHGAIDINNNLYFIENRKLYKIDDKLKRNPITKIPKIKMKVAVDIEKKEVYDHDAAMRKKTKIKLGSYNNSSKFIKL